MRRLRGKHLEGVFAQDYQSIGFACGAVIARIHTAFAGPQPQGLEATGFDEELRGWVPEQLEACALIEKADYANLIEDFCGLYDALPKQAIHRDMHLKNLLFENGELVGVLDFDISKHDARLFDLAYFTLALLRICRRIS